MNKTLPFLSIFALLIGVSVSNAQLDSYSQDFEALDAESVSALDEEGWLVGAIVTDSNGIFLYQYFDDNGIPFPAPNSESAFSNIAAGSGGPNQGEQYLNIFSDYNNQDAGHAVGNIINTFFYQGGDIGAADLNQTYRFEFDYRRGDDPFGPGGATETCAYIRVLSPAPDFFLIFEDILDTTNATSDWVEGAGLEFTVADDLEGFIFQFGFSTSASNNEPSGIYYDNISFGQASKGCLPGDLDGSGMVDLLDVAPFVDAITTGEFSCEGDVNEDGMVDLLDVDPFVLILTGG